MNREELPKRETITLTLAIHMIICGAIIGAGFIYTNFTIQAESILFWLCFTSMLLFVWLVYSWRRVAGTIFDPYGMFLLSAILFNGGQVVLEAFGLNLGGILGGRFTPESLVHSVYLVASCLSLYHLGALFATIRTTNVIVQNSLELAALRKVGWGLLAISIIPSFVQIADAVVTVMSGGYFSLYQREITVGADASLKILSYFIIPGILFLLAGSDGRKVIIRLTLILILLYCAAQFFLGYRGWATMPLAAYAWLWHRCIRPIPKRLLYGSGIMLVVAIFPFIAAVRNLSGTDRGTNELSLALSGVGNPAITAIFEMGGSLQTVAYTIELVPHVRDFDWGMGYLYALLTVVPNVWGGVHPSVASGLPSSWLTHKVEPIIAENGGGLGFSFIAEAYLNFGWIGAPIALFVLGFFFARLVLWSTQSGDKSRMVMIACFISFSLYYARGEMSGVVRQLVWYSLLPYLCAIVLTRKSQKHFC